MPVGATGSRGMTHHGLIRVAWQEQRMKKGCAMGNTLGQLSEEDGCLRDPNLEFVFVIKAKTKQQKKHTKTNIRGDRIQILANWRLLLCPSLSTHLPFA